MSITIEAIYEAGILKPLTPLPELAEQAKVRVTIEPATNLGPRVRRSPHGAVDHARQNAWLRAQQDNYRGQWVVLDGDRLVGHATDADTLTAIVERARREGVQTPFVHFINESSEPIWMRWL